jgi:hypothetical protein
LTRKNIPVKFSTYDEREFMSIGIPMGQATTDEGMDNSRLELSILNEKMRIDHVKPILEKFLSVLHNDDPPDEKLLACSISSIGFTVAVFRRCTI